MNPKIFALWDRRKKLKKCLRQADEYLDWLRQELLDTLSGWHGEPVGDKAYFEVIRLEIDRVTNAPTWERFTAYVRKTNRSSGK